ncbi:putative short-chain dehydrogenase/reductase [Aspergillus melleus]|uniref:putative short-chain dehydrogenase/reductase n=1 Tax=Aspergillus melleus TaxID=138277 RepID=UPI001E8E6C3E|nr:uncharacterized protein LDX57_001408 [Aspergillus melleus]KAH8423649.1 hypothetical protein LDX57_001408 [Aspergillus melleus]
MTVPPSPYAEAHVDPQGVGDARPTALQIIRDENLEDKLVGKAIVVTGATSGIGLETARALSATGATLFLPARDLGKARKTLSTILESGRVSLIEMDINSFASIRMAASEILSASQNQVNILINNAGVMGIQERQLTEDGHETHFATNYLGSFLLFQLLKPALLASASLDLNSRVVNVSSSAHRFCTLMNSDDYDFQKSDYSHELAYANSKLAAVYMTNEIDRRYGSKGIHATSIHPGAINTDISRDIGPGFVAAIMSNPVVLKILKSPEQGAATTVLAAVGKEWESKGGKYLEDCQEAERGKDDGQAFGFGYVCQTYDPKDEERLWRDSLKLVGVSDHL